MKSKTAPDKSGPAGAKLATGLKPHLSEYGMLVVLLMIGCFFSWQTWKEQFPEGKVAAAQIVKNIKSAKPATDSSFIIAAGTGQIDEEFTQNARELLKKSGFEAIEVINGSPAELRQALQRSNARGELDFVILTSRLANMQFVKERNQLFPNLSETQICQPQPYHWPNFLKRDNLINIANQIVVIAVLAIGMTMVIITGGIDLSVGSLIALSAVVAAWLIAALGGEKATVSTMILCSLAAVGVCALCGFLNGVFIAMFQIPPFIVTLGLMLVASGFAYIISSGESIYQMPDQYTWLGRGDILALPVGVWLMFLLYGLGHFFMNNTVLGRNIYAVGGNPDAAHLAGISIPFVLIFVYTVSAMFAGLGGVVVASQLKSGAPQYGLMYELYVIAAVVVGGTSLRGGEGRILGTLLGAFLIAIIQNGMNLTGVEAYVQKVVLGLVILIAVLFDTIRSKGWPDSLKFRVRS